jgi:hypothetical protein
MVHTLTAVERFCPLCDGDTYIGTMGKNERRCPACKGSGFATAQAPRRRKATREQIERHEASYGHRPVVHSMANDEYWAAMYRATYYRWAAQRRFVVCGGDPFNGRPAKVRQYDHTAQAEGVVVHKAQARFWLARAAMLRTKTGRDVLNLFSTGGYAR